MAARSLRTDFCPNPQTSMDPFDREAFSSRVAGMFDDQLIATLSINSRRYNDDALRIARTEAERRGIMADVQKLGFDIFLNCGSGFSGRLILLEEQLMFLSTGMRAAAGGSGIVGAIASEAYNASRHAAAADLDFSALDNEGSWIYFLDQILDCRVHPSVISGREFRFQIREEEGSTMEGFVNCSSLDASQAASVATQILAARDRFNARD